MLKLICPKSILRSTEAATQVMRTWLKKATTMRQFPLPPASRLMSYTRTVYDMTVTNNQQGCGILSSRAFVLTVRCACCVSVISVARGDSVT